MGRWSARGGEVVGSGERRSASSIHFPSTPCSRRERGRLPAARRRHRPGPGPSPPPSGWWRLTGAGHLHRQRHPRLPGPERGLDEGPAAEKASTLSHYVADPAVRRRRGATASTRRRGGRAQRRSPGPVEPRAPGAAAHPGDPEHRRAAPAGGVRSRRRSRSTAPCGRVTCLVGGEPAPWSGALDRVRRGGGPGLPLLRRGSPSRPPSRSASPSSPRTSSGPTPPPRALTRCWRWHDLTVYPVADLVPTAKRAGAAVGDRQRRAHRPFDHLADASWRAHQRGPALIVGGG